MKIIFLDMDGVLNSTKFFKAQKYAEIGPGQIDPEAVELLNIIVAETGAKIVISSSWRHIWSPEEMGDMLKQQGFRYSNNIIDQTGHANDGFRGEEIMDWVDMHRERRVISPETLPIESYVILDDTADFYTEQHKNLVRTNASVGLSPRDVKQAVKILNAGTK